MQSSKEILCNGCILSNKTYPKELEYSNGDKFELVRKCKTEACVNYRHISYKLVLDQGMGIDDRQRYKPKYPPERRAYVEGIKANSADLLGYYKRTRSLKLTAKEFEVSKSFVQDIVRKSGIRKEIRDAN